MYREIDFNINDIDQVYVSSDTFNGLYKKGRIYIGQSGEDEATQLTFSFGSDFEDLTAYLYFDGTSVASQALSSGSMDLEYEVPDTYMIPEVIKAQIQVTDGTQTFKTRLIYLEVKRCL